MCDLYYLLRCFLIECLSADGFGERDHCGLTVVWAFRPKLPPSFAQGSSFAEPCTLRRYVDRVLENGQVVRVSFVRFRDGFECVIHLAGFAQGGRVVRQHFALPC